MKRTLIILALVLLTAEWAQAQVGQPYRRPSTGTRQGPISPYLGILSGGSPAIGYFGITQPWQQQMAYEQQTNLALSTLTANQNRLDARFVPITGSSARFMSYSDFFMNVGGQRVGIPANPPGYNAPIIPGQQIGAIRGR